MITECDAPPVWLIELSMWTDMQGIDLLKLLVAVYPKADDELLPIAFWRRAVELDRVPPELACSELAAIHLPLGARKLIPGMRTMACGTDGWR